LRDPEFGCHQISFSIVEVIKLKREKTFLFTHFNPHSSPAMTLEETKGGEGLRM
jgi:hypothetical protein